MNKSFLLLSFIIGFFVLTMIESDSMINVNGSLDVTKSYDLTVNGKSYQMILSVFKGSVNEIKMGDDNSIIFQINSLENGTLNITVPRDLLETNSTYYDNVSILRNGQEITYKNNGLDCEYRSFQINFDEETSEIIIKPANTKISKSQESGKYSFFNILGHGITILSDQRICDIGIIEQGGFFINVLPVSETHHANIMIPQKFMGPKLSVFNGTKLIDSRVDHNETNYILNFNYTNVRDLSVRNTSPNIPSPLQQFNSGIRLNAIQCVDDLQLVYKSTNSHPACIKPETKQILIERGWAKPI
ncbi:MAG TPA: hypothetical protein VFM64_01000 [Candidatus Nitrosotenuis sp.]|nr:hypothetical protein [Candidatus Nitrosotenuis sp.]